MSDSDVVVNVGQDVSVRYQFEGVLQVAYGLLVVFVFVVGQSASVVNGRVPIVDSQSSG